MLQDKFLISAQDAVSSAQRAVDQLKELGLVRSGVSIPSRKPSQSQSGQWHQWVWLIHWEEGVSTEIDIQDGKLVGYYDHSIDATLPDLNGPESIRVAMNFLEKTGLSESDAFIVGMDREEVHDGVFVQSVQLNRRAPIVEGIVGRVKWASIIIDLATDRRLIAYSKTGWGQLPAPLSGLRPAELFGTKLATALEVASEFAARYVPTYDVRNTSWDLQWVPENKYWEQNSGLLEPVGVRPCWVIESSGSRGSVEFWVDLETEQCIGGDQSR